MPQFNQLIHIDEVLVSQVRHVIKRMVAHMLIHHLLLLLSGGGAAVHHTQIDNVLGLAKGDALGPLSLVQDLDEEHAQDDSHGEGDEDDQVGPQTTVVVRLLVGAEEKRTNNVTGTLADEEHCRRNLAFGIATSVLAGPGVDQGGDSGIEGDDVIASQEDGAVGTGPANGEENGASSNGWETQEKENGGLHADLVSEVGSSKSGNYLHNSEWNIEQNGRKAVESKRFDDKRSKSRNATRWNAEK